VIRGFAREDYETTRYTSVNDELLEKNLGPASFKRKEWT
jgi:hypothetical protein